MLLFKKGGQKVKRILHIVSAMDRGGAETLIMNIYRNIDRSKVQFDFVTHSEKVDDYDVEIKLLGGRIYKTESLGSVGPFKYTNNLVRIISSTTYEVVHVHTDFQCGFPALAARLSGVQNRICHSHSTNWLKNNGAINGLIFKALQGLIKWNATKLCSCSEEAAAFLFGKKSIEYNKVKILKNSIDISGYMNMGNDIRSSVIEEFDLSPKVKLLGHVGKFSESKNQKFILKVLKKVVEKDSNYVAIFVGDGPLRETIELEARKLGLMDHVKFIGVREDIARLMVSFDIFLFPSIFEGFGIVMLEAQSAGTPCLASTAVPKTVDLGLDLVAFLSIDNTEEQWKEAILSHSFSKAVNPKEVEKQIRYKGFHIDDNVTEWMNLYDLQT